MKLDKENIGKILKSKKAMKMIMVACIMLVICFYGIAMTLGHFGITFGSDILMQFGNFFVVIAVVIVIYQMLISDEKIQKMMGAKENGKSQKKKTMCENHPKRNAISIVDGCAVCSDCEKEYEEKMGE